MVLTTTELRSTQRYYHVYHNVPSKRIYPATYELNVIGIMWNTMAEGRTWFGDSLHLVYGIQTIPLTPIAEERDDPDWVKEALPSYARACEFDCIRDGWSNGELALLGTAGHADLAIEQTMKLPDEIFGTPAGNGHSKTNMVWYLSTRPDVAEPYNLDSLGFDLFPDDDTTLRCFQPDFCTEDVLNTVAAESTCKDRILWLVEDQNKSVFDACHQVAADEYPDECGGCNPHGPLQASDQAG